MILRELFAGLACLVGLFLFWEGLQAVIFITGRGSPLSDALLSPPTSLIRLVGSAFVAAGGALALLNARFGALLLIIGSLLIMALATLMAAAGADSSLWRSEMVFGIVLGVLTLGILFIRR